MSIFNYHCAKCGGSVTKPPVSETNSLGKWRCGTCGPNIKVVRTFKQEENKRAS